MHLHLHLSSRRYSITQKVKSKISTITEARKNDQSFEEHLNQVKEKGLYLQDLGYFKLKSFETLHKKGAYFISRYLTATQIFDENDQQINLLEELQKAGTFYAKELNIGKDSKLAVRLVAYRLSDVDAEKRIRRLKETMKKRGYTSKPESIELAKWSICITNVPNKSLTDEQIYLVYSLRWQIELFFKLCKSEAGIDKISGKTKDRVLCEIYAKLICVMILFYLCSPVRWQQNRELSYTKAYNQIREQALSFFKALDSPYRMIKFLKELFSDLKDFALKDKHREKRPSTYQKLMVSAEQKILG